VFVGTPKTNTGLEPVSGQYHPNTLYTTNVIKSLNMQLCTIIKTHAHFPTDKAASKLRWLALLNMLAKSVRETFDQKATMNQFAILLVNDLPLRGKNNLYNASPTNIRTGS
jgi:transposase-like protein